MVIPDLARRSVLVLPDFRDKFPFRPEQICRFAFSLELSGRLIAFSLSWLIANSQLPTSKYIPFQRESPFGQVEQQDAEMSETFPFPSNGKVLSDKIS